MGSQNACLPMAMRMHFLSCFRSSRWKFCFQGCLGFNLLNSLFNIGVKQESVSLAGFKHEPFGFGFGFGFEITRPQQ